MGYFGTFWRDPARSWCGIRRPPCRGSPDTMRLLLAAIGTTLAAVIELSLAPYLSVAGAHPHPVLVLTVIWTIVAGIEPGLVCAFLGGLVLDLLAPRPLGSTAFALLIAAGVIVSSVIYSLVLVGALTLMGVLLVQDPVGPLLPGVVYDGVLGLLVGPLAVSIRDRRVAEERVDW